MGFRRAFFVFFVFAVAVHVAPGAWAQTPVTPEITSAGSTTFVEGESSTFTITTTGDPDTITCSAPCTLPPGTTFQYTAPNDTATISGTPTASGTFTVTINATNETGTDSEQLVITVVEPEAPVLRGVGAATFIVGRAGSATITAQGVPTPTITHVAGTLPAGLSFTPGTGRATISGTPLVVGTKRITVKAENDEGEDLQAIDVIVLARQATGAPASTTPTCRTTNTSGTPTTTFRRGERFFARGTLPGVTSVTLLFDGTTRIGSDTASGGVYFASGQIPAGATLGAHTVVARGLAGSTVRSATCPVNIVAGAVLASSTGATLPRTGLPIPVLIALAVTLVELGAGLVLVADGRRGSPLLMPYFRRMRRFGRRKPRIFS